MAKKSEIRALIKRMVKRAELTWDAPGAVLENLALLHGELNTLLVSSGLYSPRDIRRLLGELDFLLLRHAAEIGALARAAQVRAWRAGEAGFEDAMGTLSIDFVKGLTGAEDELVQAFLTTDRITQVTEEMRALIRQQVLSGVYLERTPFEVMANITQVIGIRDMRGFRQIGTTGVSAKAERILRTELMTIQNAGAYQARERAKTRFPGLTDIWMATGDNRTRMSHLVAHGQKRGEDGYFTVGGWKARFPGDPGLPAHERINCRCTTMPYMEEWGEVDELMGPLAGEIEEEKDKRRSPQRHGEHRVIIKQGWTGLSGLYRGGR